jgi:phage-related protein
MGWLDSIGDAISSAAGAVESAASSVVGGVEDAVGTVVGAPVNLIQEGLQEAYHEKGARRLAA